jgi:uncharacterized membrane protein YfcA
MIFAFLGAALVGVSLGLLGSGGSIFTVPILHYALGQPEKVAVAGSLFVVGCVSLMTAIPQARAGRVDWRLAAAFGLPGVVGTWLGAAASRWVPGPVQLALFALVMLLAAGAMFMRPKSGATTRRSAWKIAVDGLSVGILTGLVGVGGGFMIVPALVLLGGLPMHTAIGTSLVIIAAKSFSGFLGYLDVLEELQLELDWQVLWIFIALGILGSLIGARIGARVSQARLRRVFSAVLVVMAVSILAAETVSGGEARAETGSERPASDAEASGARTDRTNTPLPGSSLDEGDH